MRLLYASGGTYVRAIFFAVAKNAHARLYHEFIQIHDIITSQSDLYITYLGFTLSIWW